MAVKQTAEKPALSKPLIAKLAKSHSEKKAAPKKVQDRKEPIGVIGYPPTEVFVDDSATIPKTGSAPKKKRKSAPKWTPRLTKSKKAVLEAELPAGKTRGSGTEPETVPEPPKAPEVPLPDSEPVAELLTPRQEAFVRNYVVNDALRGNATLSYADAYGYDLASMSQNDGEFDEESWKWKVKSSYRKAYDSCSALASVLIRNVKIQERIRSLYAGMLNAELIDSRLTRIIMNGKDSDSVSAIKEANRVLGRASETLKHEGLPPSLPAVVNIEIVQPAHATNSADQAAHD